MLLANFLIIFRKDSPLYVGAIFYTILLLLLLLATTLNLSLAQSVHKRAEMISSIEDILIKENYKTIVYNIFTKREKKVASQLNQNIFKVINIDTLHLSNYEVKYGSIVIVYKKSYKKAFVSVTGGGLVGSDEGINFYAANTTLIALIKVSKKWIIADVSHAAS